MSVKQQRGGLEKLNFFPTHLAKLYYDHICILSMANQPFSTSHHHRYCSFSDLWCIFQCLSMELYHSVPTPLSTSPTSSLVSAQQHLINFQTKLSSINQCLPIATATPLPLSALALLISLISTMVLVCFSMDRSLHVLRMLKIFSVTFTFLLVLPLIIQSINNSVTAPV